MFDEYIKRSAVEQLIQGTSVFAFTRSGVIKRLKDLPAADVIELFRPEEAVLAEFEDDYKDFKKIRTRFAEITVGNNVEKPYYSILWWDEDRKEFSLGYSSYCLAYVARWRELVFEVIEGAPAADVVKANSPEKAFVDEWICGNGMTFKQVADLIFLYKTGGIPLSPVKVGDRVWFICWDKVAKAWVVDETPYTIEEVGTKGFFVSYDEEDPIEFDEYVFFDDIGDECFLSLELAKAAAAVKEEPVLQEEEADETEG